MDIKMKIPRITVTLFLFSPISAETADDFLQTGFGARSAALGGAYSAAVSDPSALYWNPAGLGHIKSRISGAYGEAHHRKKVKKVQQYEEDEFNRLLQMQHESIVYDSDKGEPEPVLSSEIQLHTSAALQQSGNLHYLGAVALSIGDGALAAGYGGNRRVTDAAWDNPATTAPPHTDVAYLGYGRGSPYFRWGISLFGLQQDAVMGRRNAVGGNLGIQYDGLMPNAVIFAVDLRNLGAVESYSGSGFREVKSLDPVVSYAMRINLGFLASRSDLFLYFGATTGLSYSKANGAKLNFGISYRLFSAFHGLLGLNDTAPSLGLGIYPEKYIRFTLSARREVTSKDMAYAGELVFIF